MRICQTPLLAALVFAAAGCGGSSTTTTATPTHKEDQAWQAPGGKVQPYFGPEARWLDATGTLPKVSAADGKRHVVLTIRIVSSPTGPPHPDNDEWTYEGCIDHAAPDSPRKYTSTYTLLDPNRPNDRSAALVIVSETTIRSVK